MLGRAVFLSCVLTINAAPIGAAAQQSREGARREQTDEIHEREGEALIALADAAMAGRQVPSDLKIGWQNHFFKAQHGTFIPFIVTIDAGVLSTRSVLLYVRLVARAAARLQSSGERGAAAARPAATARFAVEEVFPIDLRTVAGPTARVTRGLSARAGEYDLVVVVRERVERDRPELPRRTGILNRTLVVPDFPSADLAASSVILADRLTVLETAPPEAELPERPYLIGLSDIQPAADNVLRRDEELIVVLLVYNPFVTPERKFDVEVEYHFFSKTAEPGRRAGSPPPGVSVPPARDDERYFNHTRPQRFTPAIMGAQFDPTAGQPLLAGQGVPLGSFPDGEYRLAIRVTDVVTGKSIVTDVSFTVVSTARGAHGRKEAGEANEERRTKNLEREPKLGFVVLSFSVLSFGGAMLLRRMRGLTAAAFVGVATIGVANTAAAQTRVVPAVERQAAHATRGRVSGVVSDERGGPLPGAMVSMLGVTMAMTVSDAAGHFALEALPAGEYVLRAHMSGFAASPRQFVRVGAAPSVHRIQLRRLDHPVATSGSTPVEARPIVAAGFGLPAGTTPEAGDAKDAAADHPHSETAWRLRHIKRSILKDRSADAVLTESETRLPDAASFGRVFDPGVAFAASFTRLPFSGEVNLLTTGALGPGDMFRSVGLPRGVAYLALGAKTAGGGWTMRAAMSEGELSSWIVAGAFQSRPAAHSYDFGVSYSTQEYQGRNPAALAAVTDGSRNVGELYGLGRWKVAPRVSVEYGGRYAHYDYLEESAMFSPRTSVTIEPFAAFRVRATIAQRYLAPGAEEFLSPRAAGPWLPPERTFAPLGGPGDPDTFRVERARSFDIAVEREFDGAYVFGVRRFYQSVDDQLITLFGLNLPSGPRSVGHYYVASAGAVDAEGWAVRVSSLSTGRVRGSLEYSRTTAHWISRGDMAAVHAWAPAAIRSTDDELHDVTTSIETDIPETATRVFVLYRLNTGFTRGPDDLGPGLDGRFDVQVNQALPLSVAGTKWEVLVGLRNLFRDPSQSGSVYDELLVVRPPTRVVGGVLVKF